MDQSAELEKILDFIENNSTKSDFVKWFNIQYKETLSEKEDWVQIRQEILQDRKIKPQDLKIYAASLSSKEDIKNVLKRTEEKVDEAEEVVHEMTYLSKYKKFSVAVGGMLLFEGILLIMISASIFTNLITIYGYEYLHNLAIFILSSMGVTTVLGGLFLVTE